MTPQQQQVVYAPVFRVSPRTASYGDFQIYDEATQQRVFLGTGKMFEKAIYVTDASGRNCGIIRRLMGLMEVHPKFGTWW